LSIDHGQLSLWCSIDRESSPTFTTGCYGIGTRHLSDRFLKRHGPDWSALQIERKNLSGIDPVWLVCSIGHGYVDRNNVINGLSRKNLHSDRAFTGIEQPKTNQVESGITDDGLIQVTDLDIYMALRICQRS
jgi:hypothetical protein